MKTFTLGGLFVNLSSMTRNRRLRRLATHRPPEGFA